MHELIQKIQRNFPSISFVQDTAFHWSAQSKTIYYNVGSEDCVWSLLHELGHASLDHTNYESDIELLHMEVAAWDMARKLGEAYDISISEIHMEDCLDTYRDWLHRRSQCPTCTVHGVQSGPATYQCLNCQTVWAVSADRFCRTYRKQKKNPV